jgi:hypothetical protein
MAEYIPEPNFNKPRDFVIDENQGDITYPNDYEFREEFYSPSRPKGRLPRLNQSEFRDEVVRMQSPSNLYDTNVYFGTLKPEEINTK